MTDRTETLRAMPILAGFLGTLLQDADRSARDSGEPGTADTIYTCPDSTFSAAADICRRFLDAPGVVDMLGATYWNGKYDDAGDDLYLTLAGHGAGFWDGDWEPHGDALTEAAHEANKAARLAGWNVDDATAAYLQRRPADMFTLETYVGDDGHVYIAGRE